MQFFLPGVPQVYYVGALAGKNDMELLRKTNNGRDINRHYYSTAEIDENLKRPVVKALNALAKFRNELDAFDGTFSYTTDDDTSISFTARRNQPCHADVRAEARSRCGQHYAGRHVGMGGFRGRPPFG